MDALESVAKEVFNMPTATFGNVLSEMRRQQRVAPDTISVLQKLYDMANNHFRHGMVTAFILATAEVDFVVLSCMAGIFLITRL
jgi:glutamate mutase epsilon subunit